MEKVDVFILIQSWRDATGATSEQNRRGLDFGRPDNVKQRICEKFVNSECDTASDWFYS